MYVSRVVAKACVLVAVGLLSSTAAWAIQAGIVFDVHQDIKDPDLWPNDFHVEGKLQSLVGLPTVINHLDGPFTKFKWEITPLGGEDYWFECTWWMEEPGVYIPYCEILHMGVLFDVDYKNIVIDVVSWWTRDGKPVGEKARGALYNDGFVPMIGFNVADGSEPQLLTIANNFVTATPPPPPAEQPPPWPPTPIKLDIVQLQAAVFDPDHEPKFEDLAEGGASEGYKWVDIVRADGSKISGDRPLSLDAGKVIDVILGEARSDADTLRAAEPIKIEPGGFLVARQLAGFTNNEGEYETRWFWEIHGAPPDEACCFPDGTCEMLQTFACLMQGGTPMGPGSQCDMFKCPVSAEPGACCYGTADPIQCEVMDVIKCRDEYKGTWHGPGSDCEDLNGNHVADVCEIISSPEQACCFDGECRMMPVEACREEKGEPQGPGSICVGDWDGDGKDETCESKWLQPPDLGRTGIDVRDMQPIALADDFLCTETNAITRIVIWGSWLHDEYPIDPANINVTLKLREDIPDPDGSGPLYSMPGKVLWSRSWRLYQQGSTFRNRAWSPLPVSRSPLITLSLYHLITRPG